ncbi:MAG: hypothetical protein FJ128_13940 [Deltaproteobacteria bacterium]|nr:hypothetical protein [Deltaproteobacteria bacterium]MBM4286327.1 hypothetical protein [Deltaproteobacteria bacterium]
MAGGKRRAGGVYLRAPGEKRRPPPEAAAVFHLDEPGVAGVPLHHNLDRLPTPEGAAGDAVRSFLLAALGVWAADKFLPRADTSDGWTRSITLDLPVAPAFAPLLPLLARLLRGMTGDHWTLYGREGAPAIPAAAPTPWRDAWQPEAVALFSGGLDSLIGAIDLLEGGRRLLLVGHHDYGQLAGLQQSLAGALAAHYGAGRVRLLSLRAQFPQTRELTLRSRSLLFLALGLAAAVAWGPAIPLFIPENGWISLNPPLTGNRLGALSTRTTHPTLLAALTAIWREAGLSTPLSNPYRGLTKGEMAASCRNASLLKRLAPATLSCARPVASRWQRQAAGHCGYCYPCLMRRAALHVLGLDMGDHYRTDILTAPHILARRLQGRHLRALLLALLAWQTSPGDLEARLWLGDDPEEIPSRLSWARGLLRAGFAEIDRWLREQSPPWRREGWEQEMAPEPAAHPENLSPWENS